MFGIFLPGLKSGFFARFSPFFTYIVTTMRMKKREKRTKNPSFQNQAKNPKHALRASSSATMCNSNVSIPLFLPAFCALRTWASILHFTFNNPGATLSLQYDSSISSARDSVRHFLQQQPGANGEHALSDVPG